MDASPADSSASQLTPAQSRRARGNWWKWVTGLVLVGLLGWYVSLHIGAWKDRFVARKWREVEPGQIYASGQIDRHLIRSMLVDHHIREIICLLGDDTTDPDVAEEIRVAGELGIQRHIYPLSGDGTGDIHQYADVVAEMVAAQKAAHPVLVHCSSGAQRSNGATFYYRVLVEHRDADETVKEIIRNGHDPRGNPLLLPYLNEHMLEMARLLVQQKVIDHVPDPLPKIHHD